MLIKKKCSSGQPKVKSRRSSGLLFSLQYILTLRVLNNWLLTGNSLNVPKQTHGTTYLALSQKKNLLPGCPNTHERYSILTRLLSPSYCIHVESNLFRIFPPMLSLNFITLEVSWPTWAWKPNEFFADFVFVGIDFFLKCNWFFFSSPFPDWPQSRYEGAFQIEFKRRRYCVTALSVLKDTLSEWSVSQQWC